MATKPNNSALGSGTGTGRGEKKASPSGTAAQPRRSPNTTKTTTSPSLSNSTSSKKLVSSNLKGTRTSEDVPISKQLGKKPLSSESSAQKPVISRRSSFDKAQSPSVTQISRNPLNSTLRSQSFSGKSVGSPKSVPEKNLKAPIKDAAKPRSLNSKPVNAVKKTGMSVKKQGTETSSTSSRKEQVASLTQKGYNPIAVPDVVESELLSENQESEGLVDSDGSNDEKNTEVPTPEYPEPLKIKQIEAERSYNAKTVTVESPKVLEHEDVFIGGVKTEEPVEEPAEEKTEVAEETNNKQQELEHYTNEINSNITDESVAGKPTEKAEEKEGVIFDKKEEAASGSEAPESMETEVEKVAEEEKKESEKTAAKPQVVAHGKKDVALSNDVIEETVSKLREQRKNKVRALAGAFETVISLQDK